MYVSSELNRTEGVESLLCDAASHVLQIQTTVIDHFIFDHVINADHFPVLPQVTNSLLVIPSLFAYTSM